MILVTGAAGFIGSHFIDYWFTQSHESIVSIDKLTYAAQPERLASLDSKHHQLIKADIGDTSKIDQILSEHQPRAIINFAAESHIDRSIKNPEALYFSYAAPSACAKREGDGQGRKGTTNLAPI